MARTEAAPANHRNLRHHAVGYGVHHFCSGADDSAPLSLFTHHEAIDVVQEDQRHQVLVAVEDKPRGFFGGLGVDNAAELDPPLAGARRDSLHVFFLVGDEAYGPAADARVAAQQRLAVLGAILFKSAAVDDPRNHLPHVVLLDGVG